MNYVNLIKIKVEATALSVHFTASSQLRLLIVRCDCSRQGLKIRRPDFDHQFRI